MTTSISPRDSAEPRLPTAGVSAPLIGRVSRTPRIKLVQIAHGMGCGGLERVVATICRGIDPERFEPQVLTLKWYGPVGEELSAHGVRVKLLNPVAGGADYIAPLRVARALREIRPNVVHTHNTQAFLEGGLGSILARAPMLVHTDHARLYPDKLKYTLAESVMAKFAYRIVGVSDATTQEFLRHHRIAREKLCTIPNGIDRTPFEITVDRREVRRELGIEGDGPVLGSIGRLVPQKGIDQMLRATSIILQQHPTATLVLAGDGPLEHELRAMADGLGIAQRVRFLGQRRDVARLLKIFDLYLLTSNFEGLPIALLEALACGCPIVSADVGGVSSVVHPGVNGELVPPVQPEMFAATVTKLLGDPARLSTYRQASRRLFLEQFTIEKMVKYYESLYVRGAA